MKNIELPSEVSILCEKVIPLKSIYIKKKILLDSIGAVYSFWWMGKKSILISSNKKIRVKGPGGKYVVVEYKDLFPKEITYIPLYIGKTTNLKRRISEHLLFGTSERAHCCSKNFKKVKPRTTSCQLRSGIEHIFPDEKHSKYFILENVGLSFVKEKEIEKRFYLENFAIGYLKPWINLDSER